MPGLVPGIHVFGAANKKDVDRQDKPGHDEILAIALYPIAATASISISQPGRASRVTTTRVEAGGFATLT